MENSFRQEFKDLLENTKIPANATEEYVGEAWKKILLTVVPHLPKSLFRFRSFNKFSKDSFRDGTITVCHPSVFPDKYDSLIYVNTDDAFLRAELLSQLAWFETNGMNIPGNVVPSLVQAIKENVSDNVGFLRTNPHMRIGCFTECVDSKFMWDTYADGYKGFALEYDTMKYYLKAASSKAPVNIFPIIYTNERYDSTEDALFMCAYSQVPQDDKALSEMMNRILPGPDQLYWFRSYLYKSAEEYSREKEWRLIHSRKDSNDASPFIDIPDYDSVTAIYYGPDIKPRNKKILHNIAVVRGLAEYDVVAANSRGFSLEIKKIN